MSRSDNVVTTLQVRHELVGRHPRRQAAGEQDSTVQGEASGSGQGRRYADDAPAVCTGLHAIAIIVPGISVVMAVWTRAPFTAKYYLRPLPIVAIALCFAAWGYATTTSQKVAAVIVAAVYSGIESSFYAVTAEHKDSGEVRFSFFGVPPEDAKGLWKQRKAFTTFEQFWANVLYVPILLDVFESVVETQWVRVLLFPFNIWLLEIVEGYFFMFIFKGLNPAWGYCGSDSFFHGNIKLSHGPLWLMLAVLVELVYFPTARPALQALFPQHASI